ncbi:MAG: hypothetical protein ACI8W7_003677 [Gammaproteobacteria bacterium]|jgi:hypothetical protein
MANQATRISLMPIPPIEANTRYFHAGPITIGVEYRLLNDALVSQHMEQQQQHIDLGDNIDDCGVSLHVFGPRDGGESLEYLRFDCFDEGPHYHYVNWQDEANDIVHIDAVADGDPLAWALDRIRTRLAPMLERAGASLAARSVDSAALEVVLPRVSEAAYRARYQHDAAVQ